MSQYVMLVIGVGGLHFCQIHGKYKKLYFITSHMNMRPHVKLGYE